MAHGSLCSTLFWPEDLRSKPCPCLPRRLVPAKTTARIAACKANCTQTTLTVRHPRPGLRILHADRRLKAIVSSPVWEALRERNELLQITEIGRDSFNLRLIQAVRDRFHDRRCIRFLDSDLALWSQFVKSYS